jgi:hypothetical protein
LCLSAHDYRGAEGTISFLTGKAGKSTSHSESGNTAYPWLQSNYGTSGAGAFNGGLSGVMDILGMGGDPAKSSAALDNFWKSSGGQFQLNQGLDAVTSKMSAAGLRQSGAYGKAMEDYRQGLASTKLNEMLQNYFGVANLGLGAGNLISGAGQWSKGDSKSTGATQGLGSLIGALASAAAAASDRRLKTNITLLSRDADGLGRYSWNWKSDPTGPVQTGVIADEVKQLRPWAYAPNFRGDGFDGVNYAMLGVR